MANNKNSFIVLGHRGSSLLWPENTLQAFENALNSGADGFELDVMVTKDEIPVLFHDPNLKRLYSLDVWVEDKSFKELKTLLEGKQDVCTLEEALSLADDRNAWVDIEIKTTKWQTAREIVEKFSPKKKIISSFRHDIIYEWHSLDSGKYLFAYIYQHYPRDISVCLNEVDLLKPEQSFVDERYLKFADRTLPWAINDREKATEIARNGYFGMISDFPGILSTDKQEDGLGQNLGYILAAIKNLTLDEDGAKIELMNTLAPVQIKNISSDAVVQTNPALPVYWDVGEMLTITLKGKPTYLEVDTSYTGLMHLPFDQLVKFLQKGINKN
jgi:glycerophosphoryl diester phosphodiesterase